MDSVVTTNRIGKVLEITLNRPKVNAIDKATSLALYEAFHTLQEDDDLLVGIIHRYGTRLLSGLGFEGGGGGGKSRRSR